MFRLDDARSRIVGTCGVQSDVTGHMALFCALAPQLCQPREPALIALAPTADAIANPIEFHRNFAIELMSLEFLLLQQTVAPRLELREALIETPRLSAVEPDRDS